MRRLASLPIRWRLTIVFAVVMVLVLLGAGTARTEGYGAMRLPEDAERWRAEQGLAPQPAFALVTRRLDLDPGSPLFTDAPVRPLVLTVAEAPADRRAALAEVASG